MTLAPDLDAPAPRDKLLTAPAIPRPVAWITTCNPDGPVNAAPFSFFNVFGPGPALIVARLGHRAGAGPQDTMANIRRTGEFVANLATGEPRGDMVATASAYPASMSGAAALGLETAPSRRVAAPLAIERRRLVGLDFSRERELSVGAAVAPALRDGSVDPDRMRVDRAGNMPVAGFLADRYARIVEPDPCRIPPTPDQGDTT
ncbi:flavin reductase [uncultured Jannaschia sp.]|uniref:flavin reductase family protein n=1 Tax=uncultured Jannaschia sp. TaxID=293347 RepID=UPI002611C2BE|nr:flavin reductase [uncultured Jannaschia sp.]